MDVRSCKNCGRLFNYLQGPPICQACKQKLEDKFIEVRDYIREYDSATMQEIAEATDTTVKQIKQWVREERLTFSDKSPVGIECETCGTMIRTGRFCDKCTTLHDLYHYKGQRDWRRRHQADGGKRASAWMAVQYTCIYYGMHHRFRGSSTADAFDESKPCISYGTLSVHWHLYLCPVGDADA